MRILHCLNLDTVGGVESVFADYLQHSGSSVHEHHVMILGRPCHPRFREAMASHARSTFEARRIGFLPIPRSIRGAIAASRASQIKADLILIYNALTDRPAWSVAEQSGACIYYERGTAWWTSPLNESLALNRLVVNRYLCNSFASARMLQLRFGVSAEDCRILHNPNRVMNFDAIARKKLGGLSFRIGMAGRLTAAKGMVVGIHAFALFLRRNPSARLLIAGEGPERASLESVAHSLGVSHAVDFLGLVASMREFYQSLDVFVCPSLREPLGNVVIEANGCGCPVVATAVDGLPEAVEDGVSGICIPPRLGMDDYFRLGVSRCELPEVIYDPVNDCLAQPRAICPSELSERLEYLYSSPSVLKSMSMNGISSSSRRFDMGAYVETFHNIINYCR